MRHSIVTACGPDARCSATGSLTLALNRAVLIAFEEFRIPGDVPSLEGSNCLALRGSWDSAREDLLRRVRNRKESVRRRLSSTLSSCSRLFDRRCKPCDFVAERRAKEKWDRHVAKDVDPIDLTLCRSWLPALRLAVRELLGGWGRRLDGRRVLGGDPFLGEYVPDQQGCFEVVSCEGGTIACSPDEYSGDWALVRRGVAKTKGKHRVVTMQSAEVKSVLTPVHNALYDHISSFGWCVRGDVRKEDFEAVVADRREGERYISGDYQSATDNIYLPAVEAIVDEISKCPELTERERSVLLGSFRDLRWRSYSGKEHPIKRGSMMGNLVSFPILCLLNKACFDIACDITYGSRVRRVGRFNGDDCMFPGSDFFFDVWKQVTSTFGLVVNESKTEVSSDWLVLNSTSFSVKRGSLLSKPVLSFLRPVDDKLGSILPSVIKGIESFRWSTQLWIVNGMMLFEISLRGTLDGISCLGPRWRKELLSRRWFRSACLSDRPPVKECGVDRSSGFVVRAPPHPRVYDFVTKKAAELSAERVARWRGVRVTPHSIVIDRTRLSEWRRRKPSPRLSSRFLWGGWQWAFVWPRELYDFFESRYPWLLRSCLTSSWADDHPFLTRRPLVLEERRCPSWRNPIFASDFCSQWPLGHR